VSVQLDAIIWEALQDIATQQGLSVHELVTEIARDSLHLAIHVYIAEFYRSTDASQGEAADPTSQR
jgi:predicted DNA-binding ribbon-helix-helix protein